MELTGEEFNVLNSIYMDWRPVSLVKDLEILKRLYHLGFVELSLDRAGDDINTRLTDRGRTYLACVAHEWE